MWDDTIAILQKRAKRKDHLVNEVVYHALAAEDEDKRQDDELRLRRRVNPAPGIEAIPEDDEEPAALATSSAKARSITSTSSGSGLGINDRVGSVAGLAAEPQPPPKPAPIDLHKGPYAKAPPLRAREGTFAEASLQLRAKAAPAACHALRSPQPLRLPHRYTHSVVSHAKEVRLRIGS